jgi:glycine oxidase
LPSRASCEGSALDSAAYCGLGTPARVRVAVIGAGVMGCGVALSVADRGADVTVIERAVPGAEASSAAAGILGAQVELDGRAEEAELFVRARDGWAAWATALREASGIDVGYRETGVLRVAMGEVEHDELAREVAWHVSRGLDARLLDGDAARAIEPQLAPGVVGAAYFPKDAQVDPPALLRALMVAISRNDRISVRSGTTVERLLVAQGRCVGVSLHEGELRADVTVLAAGSWSSLIAGVPVELPAVRPVRGQIVLLDERPPRLRTIVFGARAYVVPRGDGRVLCGSTMEHVGFRREVTAAGVHSILNGSLTCVPSLGGAHLAATWSNFRPHAPGHVALVGPSPLPGLFLATGHYRNGILLSKVTADFVANAVVGGG